MYKNFQRILAVVIITDDSFICIDLLKLDIFLVIHHVTPLKDVDYYLLGDHYQDLGNVVPDVLVKVGKIPVTIHGNIDDIQVLVVIVYFAIRSKRTSYGAVCILYKVDSYLGIAYDVVITDYLVD